MFGILWICIVHAMFLWLDGEIGQHRFSITYSFDLFMLNRFDYYCYYFQCH